MKKPMNGVDIVDEATLLLAFTGQDIIVNTEDNSYKYYTYKAEQDKVIYYWGRIGYSPHSLEEKAYSLNDAINRGRQKLREKMNKPGNKAYREL